ncbi:MAG TPA: GNAT family N-acetyltransferase [Gemmatimonadota bacterium]|nr:GNAT family N-acetyltransferase [Gemmatimonadota bacterium]
MNIDTQHDEAESRFFAVIDGQTAHLDYGKLDGRVLDYRHTWVPESLRGRGIGARLVLDALDWARDHDYRVMPSCPFVEAIVRRHPEYDAIITRGG